MRLAALIGSLLLALVIGGEPARAEPRVALVIGNSAYQNAPFLRNPANDAGDMAASLTRLGYSVTTVMNGSYDQMRRALIEFGREARGAELAVIFFAGHGIQMAGENWVIPVDAQLASDLDVPNEAIGLQSMVRAVSNTTKLGLVILDACRNDPFLIKMLMTKVSRVVERGLSRVEPSDNVLVAYAARDGTTARDGTGRNSPFTGSLLKYIETPGLEVRFLFANVRDDVMAATGREQQPFVYGSLSKEQICLSSCARPSVVAAGPRTDAPTAEKARPAAADALTEVRREYELALQLGTIDAWSAFLRHNPDGFYAELARGQLSKLTAAKAVGISTANPAAADKAAPPAAPAISVAKATDPEELKRRNEAQFFMLKVCNKSARRASVAVMGRTAPDATDWHVEGWWNVAPNQCSNLKKYVKGQIYLFAQEDGNPRVMWRGNAAQACVATPGPFDRVNRDAYRCAPNERLVSFSSFSASEESFVWNLTPLSR